MQRIHSTFGFAIGHRSQPRFGETCREEKKSRENVCPRTFHMERQISRRGNVFIFDSPASAKCLFHESSSLSPSRRFEYNVSRDSTNAYMNLNRKKFVTEENGVCEFFVFELWKIAYDSIHLIGSVYLFLYDEERKLRKIKITIFLRYIRYEDEK